jgi:hypothetical protein
MYEMRGTYLGAEEGRGAHRIFVEKPDGKSPLERRSRRWVDNIKIKSSSNNMGT